MGINNRKYSGSHYQNDPQSDSTFSLALMVAIEIDIDYWKNNSQMRQAIKIGVPI